MKKFWIWVAAAALLFGIHGIARGKQSWLERVAYLYVENEPRPFAVFDKAIAEEKADFYQKITNKTIATVFYDKKGELQAIVSAAPVEKLVFSPDGNVESISEKQKIISLVPAEPFRIEIAYRAGPHSGIARHVAAARKAEIEEYGRRLFKSLEELLKNGRINYEEYLDLYEAATQEYEWYASRRVF